MTNALTVPSVSLQQGRAVTTSNAVAELFGKLHKHVLRDIDNLLALGGPNLDHLFKVHATYHDKARKLVRGFDLTKDGFMLLAMGFRGERALQFKLAYIARFNELEAGRYALLVP